MKDYKKKIDKLMAAVEDLDWKVIIMADPGMDKVPGLVIGEEPFLETISEILKTIGSALELPIETVIKDVPESKLKPKKNDDDPTFH